MSLGPTARNLVAAARGGLDPASDVAARVRAKVALAVGGASSVASTSAGRSSVASSKIIGLVAAGALIVTAWLVVHHSTQVVAPASIPAPALITSDEPQVEPHFAASVDVEAAPSSPPPEVAALVHAARKPIATAMTPATLAREVALLDAVMTSLHENDFAEALATLATYDHETLGHGQLAEDASALEIEALCRTREPVADKLLAFDQRWPHSVQRARITERCSDPSKVQPRGLEPENGR